MVRKLTPQNSPGTATTWAGNDWNYQNKYLLGYDQSVDDPVTIATITRYWDNRLKFYNPAKSKAITIRTLPFLNDYDLALPQLTSNDEIVGLITDQRLQNKTINYNENHIKHSATNAVGDLMVGNGTELTRLPMPPNAGYHLAIKNDLTGLEYVSPAAGTGEVNTGSNIGTAGVGPYHSKSGLVLRFKKINAAPNGRIVVTDDTANNEIDIGIQGGTDGQFLKTVGGTPTWSTLTSQYGTVLPDGTNFSGPRFGKFMGGALNGDGQLAGVETFGAVTTNMGAELTTVFTTEAEDDAVGGWVTPNQVTSRQYNPHFKARYRQVLTTEKSWVGYINSDDPITGTDGDNPLIDHSGFMFGFAETDPNFLIRWNNGGPSPQTFNSGIPKDMIYRSIEFFLDETVDQIKFYINNVLTVNSGTQVPAATQGLNLHFLCESAGGTATPLRMDYAYITHTPALVA